jgi:glucose/arabinose dehydrogenase
MRLSSALLCLFALLISTPVRADEPLREGEAAYGDWRSDAPGVRRLITPDDMPPPNATPSAGRWPRLAPRPAGMTPKAPEGFAVDLFSEGLKQPRVMRVAPNGDVFLAESGANQVRVFRTGADDKAASTVFAAGLNRPFGIAFLPAADPQWVYVASTDKVERYPYRAGDLKARGPAETVVANLPTGGHWTRDLAFSPDGRTLYVSVGSESNVAEKNQGFLRGAARALGLAGDAEEGRAVVLAFDPDGSHRRLYATGLRNCSGLATQPETGALWCVANERDGLGDNLVPDFVTRVREGGFYGWPWYYIGAHEDPRHKDERPDLAASVVTPEVLLQPHSAPLGMAFYDGGAFPPEYRGDAFVAMHGSWNRSRRTGYKVVRLRIRDGAPSGEYDDFLTGFVASDDAVWGRPVDVAVTKDGALLVSDDEGGAIWRVRYDAP